MQGKSLTVNTLDNTVDAGSKLDEEKTVQSKLSSDQVDVVDQVESRRDCPLICAQTEGSSPLTCRNPLALCVRSFQEEACDCR